MQAKPEEFDVVVVGVGAAGAAAALGAHECGARVLVLEKCGPDTAGGNTRLAGGAWFINRNPERAAVYLRSLCGEFPIPEDVVEAWAGETAKNSDWLRALGAEVEHTEAIPSVPEYPELDGNDSYEGSDSIRGKIGNSLLYNFYIEALAERGIEVRFDSPVLDLVQNPDSGAVCGVEVEVEVDGERRQIAARGGVVLATGGFEADPGMVRDYLRLADPPRWGSPACTGDGHRMAQKIGADLWHMNNMAVNIGFKGDDETGFFLSLWAAHNYLFVAPDGRRFTDETAPPRHGHSLIHGHLQHFPVHPMHIIFDERMRLAGPLSAHRDILAVGWKVLMEDYRWSDDNSAEVEKGWIQRADTLAELAEKIGIAPATLECTVQNYNAACEHGIDDGFGRNPKTLGPVSEPPYYAIASGPLLGWSNGGPRRDGRARVLDTSGNAIAGLYAAGTVSSTYSACKDGGYHIADALAFGRIAGREAAARSGC